MRIVFMGSPEFALPPLTALAQNYQVVGVITQPDRPAGRGKILTPPPVKSLALSLDIPVMQPEKLKDTAAMEQLQAWQPDLIVVAAFGQILRQNVLEMPHLGCINIHASLLPRWRGAAPIQAAILNGDNQTGVTIMLMDAGVDTGAILSQRIEPIKTDDTTGVLSARLANIGAELLFETLPLYLNKSITPQNQPEQGMTYAPMLKKEDAKLDFSQSAQANDRKIRAYNPWPGAFTIWRGNALKLLKSHVIDSAKAPLNPGATLVIEQMPAVYTSKGILVFDEVQPAGKKIMPGNIFLQGARSWGDDIL
jgi:methionyl-tRNA formyltransferase